MIRMNILTVYAPPYFIEESQHSHSVSPGMLKVNGRQSTLSYNQGEGLVKPPAGGRVEEGGRERGREKEGGRRGREKEGGREGGRRREEKGCSKSMNTNIQTRVPPVSSIVVQKCV